LRDNHIDDKYLYEIVVETGPQDNHATTSNINFVLSGGDEDTDVRCFSDNEREIFKKSARDGFLMSVPHPLGSLEYIRIWTDSSGLGEMSAWYLMT
jgi:polycystin 1L2